MPYTAMMEICSRIPGPWGKTSTSSLSPVLAMLSATHLCAVGKLFCTILVNYFVLYCVPRLAMFSTTHLCACVCVIKERERERERERESE